MSRSCILFLLKVWEIGSLNVNIDGPMEPFFFAIGRQLVDSNGQPNRPCLFHRVFSFFFHRTVSQFHNLQLQVTMSRSFILFLLKVWEIGSQNVNMDRPMEPFFLAIGRQLVDFTCLRCSIVSITYYCLQSAPHRIAIVLCTFLLNFGEIGSQNVNLHCPMEPFLLPSTANLKKWTNLTSLPCSIFCDIPVFMQ